jgi:hypothetical protein
MDPGLFKPKCRYKSHNNVFDKYSNPYENFNQNLFSPVQHQNFYHPQQMNFNNGYIMGSPQAFHFYPQIPQNVTPFSANMNINNNNNYNSNRSNKKTFQNRNKNINININQTIEQNNNNNYNGGNLKNFIKSNSIGSMNSSDIDTFSCSSSDPRRGYNSEVNSLENSMSEMNMMNNNMNMNMNGNNNKLHIAKRKNFSTGNVKKINKKKEDSSKNVIKRSSLFSNSEKKAESAANEDFPAFLAKLQCELHVFICSQKGSR